MNYRILFIFIIVLSAGFFIFNNPSSTQSNDTIVRDTTPTSRTLHDPTVHPRLRGLDIWERPSGPPHVAIQIGHLHTADAPDELHRIRRNTGAQHAHITETAAMERIANLTKDYLEAQGITVTLLPVTIPPNFYADVFLSLHADGSHSADLNGYKVASSWYDVTQKGATLARILEKNYEAATGLIQDDNTSANMKGYYAFNWYRFNHSAHPMSVSAIVETGFLTNATDRTIIVDQPERSARGIADGVLEFLQNHLALVTPKQNSNS